MGLLLDPELFLAAKDISKVKLSAIEQKVFPKPIPCIAMFSMTTEHQHCLIDQILVANPSDAEIEAHLADALSAADQHTQILLKSMQHAGRKRLALEQLAAYLPVHKQISQHSFTALKVLKKQLLTLHTTGKPPQGYSLTNTPNLLQYLTHLYRYKSSIHPVGFRELENIYLEYHNIHVDDFVEPVYLSNQSPLASDSLPFFDPLAAITKAA